MPYEERLDQPTLIDIDMRQWLGKPLNAPQRAALRRHKAFVAKKNKRRGVKLQEFRKRLGVSQTTLARLLRVSRRSINYYESGAHSPRIETQAILLYLGYAWCEMKWSRRRSDSIQCVGEIMNSPSVDGVAIFYFWWCYDERGEEMSDWACKRLSDALERRLIYTKNLDVKSP